MIILKSIKNKISKNEYRLLTIFLFFLFLFIYGKLIEIRNIKKNELIIGINKINRSIEQNHNKKIHFQELEYLVIDLEEKLQFKKAEYNIIKNQNELLEYLEKKIDSNFILENISTNYFEKNINEINLDFMDIEIEFQSEYLGLVDLIENSDFKKNKIFLNEINLSNDENFILCKMNVDIFSSDKLDNQLCKENININRDLFKRESPFKNLEENGKDKNIEIKEYKNTEEEYNNTEKTLLHSGPNGKLDIIDNTYSKIETDVKNIKKYDLELCEVIASNDEILSNYLKHSYGDKKNNRLEYEFISKDNINIIYCSFKEHINIYGKVAQIYLNLESYDYMPVEMRIIYKDNKGKLIHSTLNMDNTIIGKNRIALKEPLENPIEIIGLELLSEYGVDSSNVLFLDSIEIEYMNINSSYILHKVEEGQSLNNILFDYYGNLSMIEDIKKINGLDDENIKDVKIIILTK